MGDKAASLRVGQQVVDTGGDLFPVGAAARRAATRHERQPRQRAHRHVAAVAAGAEGAVVVLPLGQILQALLDRPMGPRRDQLRRGGFRVGLAGRRSGG
jgi:hypothetical protein